MTDTHPHAIFVYGTLKSGYGNNALIEKHGGKFIAPAQTALKFLLNDGFPFVWEVPTFAYYQERAGNVIGEVYRVSDEGLEACDRLEGHPRFYCRTTIGVQLREVPKPIYLTAGIYLSQYAIPALDSLQKPRDGFLEWGRDAKEQAMAFQRERRARENL